MHKSIVLFSVFKNNAFAFKRVTSAKKLPILVCHFPFDFSKFSGQYLVSLAMSLLLSLLLLVTVAMIVFFEVLIQKTIIQDVFSDRISLIQLGRYAFVILMILMSTSFLFKFGIKRDKNRDFITVGSVFTTILIIITSYGFGIWVVKFSKYNELYGSIGTLLIMMFYIWINCMILLLGFELNAVINKHNNVRIQ